VLHPHLRSSICGLLVVGWYLLSPPVAGTSFNPDAPLREWRHAGGYDTAAACEEERRSWIQEAGQLARISPVGEASEFSLAMFKGAVLSICVTSDDFRLR
jgi:hypothetical protein